MSGQWSFANLNRRTAPIILKKLSILERKQVGYDWNQSILWLSSSNPELFCRKTSTNSKKAMLLVSYLFTDVLNGTYRGHRSFNYGIRASTRSQELPYFLADECYPNRQLFSKPFYGASDDIDTCYTERQEGLPKDIEPGLGVSQSMFLSWEKMAIIDMKKTSFVWLKPVWSCKKLAANSFHLFVFVKILYRQVSRGQA